MNGKLRPDAGPNNTHKYKMDKMFTVKDISRPIGS